MSDIKDKLIPVNLEEEMRKSFISCSRFTGISLS